MQMLSPTTFVPRHSSSLHPSNQALEMISRAIEPPAYFGEGTAYLGNVAMGGLAFFSNIGYLIPQHLMQVGERVTYLFGRAQESSSTWIDFTQYKTCFSGILEKLAYDVSGADYRVEMGITFPTMGAFIVEVVYDTAIPSEITERPLPAEPKHALDVVSELTGFLKISEDVLGEVVGRGRTTFSAWRRGVHPRNSGVSRLFALDALVSTLRRRLGDQAAFDWFHGAARSRLRRLREGGWDEVQDEAARLIFRPVPQAEAVVGADLFLEPEPDASPAKVSQPKPARVTHDRDRRKSR